jgi:hypothetical protein
MEAQGSQIFPSGSLVFLRPGKYFVVSDDGDETTKFHEMSYEAQGIVLEYQGELRGQKCWHVLVNSNVILVWDENITEHTGKKN